MRRWDTLEPGDLLLERPALGERSYLVLRVEASRTTLLDLIHAWECHVPRPIEPPDQLELNEMYEVIEGRGG